MKEKDSAVNFAAMANAHDLHEQNRWERAIDDTVVPNAISPLVAVRVSFHFATAGKVWILANHLEGGRDTKAFFRG